MTKQELILAKEALYQYELIRIKRMEALPSEEIQLSKAYYDKKAELTEKVRTHAWRARALTCKQKLGVMIAAVLLVAMIATACAFGNQIKGFLVRVFDSFVTADYVGDSSNSCVEYKMSWLPENYKEVKKANTNSGVQTIYLNQEKQIIFAHHPASYINKVVDAETTEFETFDLDGRTIYFNIKGKYYSVYWANDDATFSLLCETDIAWSNVEKMIRGVVCVE